MASELERDGKPAWYVAHTYSGYENKVKANLEKRVESMGMQDKIFRVVVPEEEETDIKNGKKNDPEFVATAAAEILLLRNKIKCERNKYNNKSKPKSNLKLILEVFFFTDTANETYIITILLICNITVTI